jgi:hypothetical protein
MDWQLCSLEKEMEIKSLHAGFFPLPMKFFVRSKNSQFL